MKKIVSIILKISILIISMALFIGNANAQNTPQIDKKQKRQKVRMADGIVDGELSCRETAKLMNEQRKVIRIERRVKSDGIVTIRERVRLNKTTRRASQHIAKEKNDVNSW